MKVPAYRAYNTRLACETDVLALDLDPECGGVEVMGLPVQNALSGLYEPKRIIWPWSEVELIEMESEPHRDRAATRDFLGLMASAGEDTAS